MLQQSILDRSWRVIVLGERDPKLVQDTDPEALRWRPFAEVASSLKMLPFELVVAKPLVESHRTTELLNALPRSKAIWMLRHYLPVATSNLGKFGRDNGFRDLAKLVAGDSSEWRAQGSEEVRERIRALMTTTHLSDLDAAALFWWARNQLYFDQRLMEDDRVRVLRYESVVNDPAGCIAAVSAFIDTPLPRDLGKKAVRQSGKVKERLQPQIEEVCEEMLHNFDRVPELKAI